MKDLKLNLFSLPHGADMILEEPTPGSQTPIRDDSGP